MDDWTRLRPLIEKALPYNGGTHTIEDIEAGLAAGRFHFWGAEKSAVVTEFVEYPQLRALNVFLIGGELNEVRAMAPQIEQYAREHGCKRIQGAGRPGWERALPGFRRLLVVGVKEIE